MANSLAKVDDDSLWRGHLKVSSNSPVPTPDDYDVWSACETGLSVTDAAAHFELEPERVRSIVKKVDKFFISSCAVDVARLKMKQHMRLEAIVNTALTDYQESGGTVRTTQSKMTIDGECIEQTITEKQMTRDPRFLSTAMKAMEEQRKMLPGANAPSASSLTNAAGDGDPKIDINHIAAQLTPDQIKALEAYERIIDVDQEDS